MTTDEENLSWWSEEMLDDPPQTRFASWADTAPAPEPATGPAASLDSDLGGNQGGNLGGTLGGSLASDLAAHLDPDLAATNPTVDRAGETSVGPAEREGRRHPARLALGMAVLAAERLGPGPPRGAAFVTGVGLVAQTATQARVVVRTVLGPPARIASTTAWWAAALPGADVPRRSLSRSRALVDRMVAEARKRGETAVTAGRTDASAFVQARVAEGIAWARSQAAPQIIDGLVPHLVDRAMPQIVDGLVPHLVDSVLPRLIDGAMPEIRAKVMPAVIEDLTNDPRVRDLVLEQGLGVVGEAAEHLRSTTATADDRVESAFRRLVRSPAAPEDEPPLGPGRETG